MAKSPKTFFRVVDLPKGFQLLDPSHLCHEDLLTLWEFLTSSQKDGQVGLMFSSCDPWSGSGSPIFSQPVLLSSIRLADLPLWLVNDPKLGPTSSPKYSSSEDDDDEQSYPERFGLFPLAFQERFLPMSFLLSLRSHPEKIRPMLPSFWQEVKKSHSVRTSSWWRWDGSRRRIP